MIRTNTLAAAIGAALTLGYGVGAYAIPAPGAIADGFLEISNFTILAGNGAAGKSGTALAINGVTVAPGTGNINLDSNVSNAQTSSALTGFASDTDNASQPTVGGTLDIFSSSGAGYVPRAILNGPAAVGSFAGGSSKSDGNALDPATPNPVRPTTVGDLVPVESQVSLANGGLVGSATARQNLLTQFTLIVGSNQTFELNFDAAGYLRAALGQAGIQAASSYNWTASVTDKTTGDTILDWAPNGTVNTAGLNGDCVGLGTCTEYLDGFNLNRSISVLSTQDLIRDNLASALHSFEVELTLAPGTYIFSIDHKSSADASIAAVPEPGTLALLGLGLLGVGAQRRRGKAA